MNGGKTSSSVGSHPSDRRVLGECPPGFTPMPHAAAIDGRVQEMRALLARTRPASDAEALRFLRSAFPEASLAARVAAMATARG